MRIDSSRIGVRAPMPVVMRLRFPLPAPNIPIGPPVYLRRIPSIAGLGDEARFQANLQSDVAAYKYGGLPLDQQVAAITADLTGLCASFPSFNAVDGANATCPSDIGQEVTQAVYANPAPVQQQQQQTQQSGGGAAVSTTVQLTNTSRPGQTFQVGDGFTLSVVGAANSPVTGSGTQNGVSKGTTPYGNTDGSGRFSISGTMTADTIGSWTEVWTVGGVPAQQLSFSVSAKPSATPAPTGGGSTQTSSTPPASTSTSSSTSSMSTNSTATGGSSDIMSWFTKSSVCCGANFSVPNWVVVAAVAGVALWFMSSRGKR